MKQTEHGYYETGLLWKANAPELPDNKQGSLVRLDKLIQRLERQPELFEQYDEIIRDQEEKGIVGKYAMTQREKCSTCLTNL